MPYTALHNIIKEHLTIKGKQKKITEEYSMQSYCI